MKKRLLLVCWVGVLSCFHVQGQVDSLLAATANAPSDSVRLVLLNAAFRQILFSDPERGLAVARQYLATAERAQLPGTVAKGHNFVGMSHYTRGDYEPATQAYLEALRRAETAGDSLYAAIVQNNVAACFEARKKPDEAIFYFRQALGRFQRLGDASWVAKVSTNLAKQYFLKKDLAASLQTYQLAYQSFTALNDPHNAGLALTGIGNYYHETRQYEQSLGYYRQSAALLDRSADPVSVAIVLENIGNALVQLGRLQEAEPPLREALQLARQHQSLEHETNILRVFVLLASRRGDYKAAFEWQERYLLLSDSLFSREKDAAMVDALQRYESEKKEQQITLLNTENQVKDLRLQNARRRQAALLLGLGLLGLLMLGGWYLFRLKQRSNRQLAEKNALISRALAEKELLLREIHHRVKNNLQVISSLLKLQSLHLTDPQALDALNEGRHRVQSMALIHQNLYSEGVAELTAIEAKGYIQKLCDSLFRAYNIRPGEVQLQTRIAPLLLDVDTAVPLGLILNELISNALKHAFEPNQPGVLQVELTQLVPDELVLRVADNGKGGVGHHLFAADYEQGAFGAHFVRMLAEKLEADIQVTDAGGTAVVLRILNFKLVNQHP